MPCVFFQKLRCLYIYIYIDYIYIYIYLYGLLFSGVKRQVRKNCVPPKWEDFSHGFLVSEVSISWIWLFVQHDSNTHGLVENGCVHTYICLYVYIYKYIYMYIHKPLDSMWMFWAFWFLLHDLWQEVLCEILWGIIRIGISPDAFAPLLRGRDITFDTWRKRNGKKSWETKDPPVPMPL